MNNMRKYSVAGIFTSLLLVFSIFTLLSITEVNAEETISVNATGYENTIIIELENESTSKIKIVRVWPGGEVTFASFKSEPGWGGGKYSEGKMVIFTATKTLNPGESVKFGLIMDKKIDAINWKALDQNDNDIDSGKISIQEISETVSSYAEEESKTLDEAKETGDALYGAKKFIPDKFRINSDIRIHGSGFDSRENLQLYLDNIILKTVRTDQEGNFLTTIRVPESSTIGLNEFTIKDESGNFQSTNVNVEESKNRFLKTTKFQVTDIPAEVRYGDDLIISGNAYPGSSIIIEIEDSNRILEKVRVVSPTANGEWTFEETVERDEALGEKFIIFKNNNDQTAKNVTVKSDNLIEISTTAIRYNLGETVSITGTSEPNKETVIWIKDENKKIIHYDIFKSDPTGGLNYSLNIDDTISTGTYAVIVKQEDAADATLFGIGKYPSTNIIALLDKTNFSLNSKAVLSVIGPQSANAMITVLDSNDNVEMTENIITSSLGKNKHAVDLDGFPSGVYRIVVTSGNIQDSVKFSIGLEAGSGEIMLSTTKENYSPGESILVIGKTGSNARLTVTLFDPTNNISSITEIFSDSSGNFSTEEIGIPSDGELGDWKITAHSRLDNASIEVNVSTPASKGLLLQIDETEFEIGDTVVIKGNAKSDSSYLQIEIIDDDEQVVIQLATPITSDNTFTLPWQVPNGMDTGEYEIRVSDGENSDSVEILIV